MRLLRAYHGRINEMPEGSTPLIPSLASYLEARGVSTEEGIPDALVSVLGAATGSANRLRDRFSIDAWASLADLQKTVERMSASVEPGDDAAVAMGVLLRKITGFSGLVHDNMYRFSGWRFLSLGRALERALSTVHLLQIFADPIAPEGGLDLCIEIGDSVMTHRRRYSVNTNRATVIDLLALDPLNPRSVACQVEEIVGQINLLPGAGSSGRLSPLAKAALRLSTDISVHTPETLDAEALTVLAAQIYDLSNDLGDTYFN